MARESAYDTAGSAMIIAEQQLKGASAVGGNWLSPAQRQEQHDSTRLFHYPVSPRLLLSSIHPDTAAIASELAAQHFGLDVLEKNIEDDDSNFTRFLLLSRQPISSLIPSNVPAKTSIVFITPNTPGALYKVGLLFCVEGIPPL